MILIQQEQHLLNISLNKLSQRTLTIIQKVPEFIAILELLAFLSTSIAFRMDVNTRENFLETAERRDQYLNLQEC